MSRRLKLCSGVMAVRKFKRAGWIVDRQVGSHIMLVKKDISMSKPILQKLFLLVCLAAGLAAAALAPSPALAAPGDLIPAFGTGGVKTFAFSLYNAPYGAAINGTGMYIAGAVDSGGKAWHIEKRDLTTGNLIASFGSGGVVTSDPRAATNDMPLTLLVDNSGLYVMGSDSNVSNPGYSRWRIEKRDITTGSLISGFGSGGVVTSDPYLNYDDVSYTGILDGTNMYVLGTWKSGGATCGWRIEKRDTTTGNLVSGFGSGGVITFAGSKCLVAPSNPDVPIIPPNLAPFGYTEPYMPSIAADSTSLYVYVYGTNIYKFDKTTGSQIGAFNPKSPGMANYSDTVFAMAVDTGGLYIVGEAASPFHPNSTGWLVEKRDLTTGALIAAFNPNSLVGPDSTLYNANNPYAIKFDGGGGIYIAGEELVTGQSKWRVENRDVTTGTLNTSFGTSGIVTSDPTTYDDGPHHILIGSDGFYIIGTTGRSWSSPSPREIRIEKREMISAPPPPTVNLTPMPSTITSGGSSTLLWASTDATSCTAVSPAGWTSSTATSGSEVVWPAATTTYTISCTGAGGTTQQSATVTVTAPVCADGDLIWGKFVDLATYVGANDIAVDNNGIYIVGYENSDDKWRMEKRDFSGNVLWTKTFDNIPGNGSERAEDVAVDSTGMYIVGGNYLAGNSYQWRMEKRSSSDGTLIWEKTSNPSNNDTGWQVDLAYGVAVDTTGVYVVGEESLPSAGDSSWRIEKRDLSDGSLLWVKEIDPDSSTSPYLQDRAMAVAVNGAGLYVVGWETTHWAVGPAVDTRWRIEKRDPSTGNLIWARTSKYGPADTQDVAKSVTVDSSGIYVVGNHYSSAGGLEDWRMEKWDFNGNQLWQQTYSSGGANQDWAEDVAVDGTGVYVGGMTALSAHMRKLSLADGSLLWSVTTWVSFPQDPGEMSIIRGLAVDCRGVYWAGDYNSGVDRTWTVSLREAGGSCGCGIGGGGTPLPTFDWFTATPSTINSGNQSTLAWGTTGASSCTGFSPAGWITAGGGGGACSGTAYPFTNGCQIVSPTTTTRYTIQCYNAAGDPAQQSVWVTVNAAPGGSDCGLRMYDGTATVTLTCEDPPVSPLRIYKNGTTYGISVVDTTDPNASPMRVQTGPAPGDVKAIRKQ